MVPPSSKTTARPGRSAGQKGQQLGRGRRSAWSTKDIGARSLAGATRSRSGSASAGRPGHWSWRPRPAGPAARHAGTGQPREPQPGRAGWSVPPGRCRICTERSLPAAAASPDAVAAEITVGETSAPPGPSTASPADDSLGQSKSRRSPSAIEVVQRGRRRSARPQPGSRASQKRSAQSVGLLGRDPSGMQAARATSTSAAAKRRPLRGQPGGHRPLQSGLRPGRGGPGGPAGPAGSHERVRLIGPEASRPARCRHGGMAADRRLWMVAPDRMPDARPLTSGRSSKGRPIGRRGPAAAARGPDRGTRAHRPGRPSRRSRIRQSRPSPPPEVVAQAQLVDGARGLAASRPPARGQRRPTPSGSVPGCTRAGGCADAAPRARWPGGGTPRPPPRRLAPAARRRARLTARSRRSRSSTTSCDRGPVGGGDLVAAGRRQGGQQRHRFRRRQREVPSGPPPGRLPRRQEAAVAGVAPSQHRHQVPAADAPGKPERGTAPARPIDPGPDRGSSEAAAAV